MSYVGEAVKYISNQKKCHLLPRMYNSGIWEYGILCNFFIVFPENEVEYENIGKFSFTAFLKNCVGYGIVGKFRFTVFLNNGVAYGLVGKFSFIVFIKKAGWNYFLVFSRLYQGND
jgi:hypothetical protein